MPLRLLLRRSDGVPLGVRERGEMERRGEERSRWEEGGLAAVGVWERVRERPREGEGEAMVESSRLGVRWMWSEGIMLK